MANSLFDRWREIADKHADTVALVVIATGKKWTFAELGASLDKLCPWVKGKVYPVSPAAGTKRFILNTLRAWRDEAVLLPYEGIVPPPRPRLPLPAGTVHLKFTSGSTGRPKFIAFSASALSADAQHLFFGMGLSVAYPNLGVISLAHSYGFSSLVLLLLLRGIPLWMAESPLPESMRAAFARLPAPCTLPAVPAMWMAWHGAGILGRAPIKLAISAGAPLSLLLERAVYDSTGLKIHNFYGASETGGIAYDSTETPRSHAAVAGTALYGLQMRIGQDECLVVESDAVGMGYWPAVQGQHADQWNRQHFYTTDLASLSPGGELFLLGRKSDVIHVAGRKVDPSEVETVLHAHPAVQHCVVFGIPSANPARQDEIVACIHLDLSAERSQVKAHIQNHLMPWQCPRHWWWRRDLIPNERGKISRNDWRERYLEEHSPKVKKG